MAVKTEKLTEQLKQKASTNMDNANSNTEGALTINKLLSKENIKKRLNELLGAKREVFMTSVIQLVDGDKNLKECDPSTVLASAITSATLDLPLNKNLGYAYVVPYNCKNKDGTYTKKATFQVGYKGFIQLAIRSSKYLRITVSSVKKGEIRFYNRFTDDIQFGEAESEEIVGYMAYFRLTNGFEKYLYMTCDDVKYHAGRYSKTFGDKGSLWQTDFNTMAEKTVLKRLLSKFGVISVEMQKALEVDQSVINGIDENGELDIEKLEYIDIKEENLIALNQAN